MKSAFLVAGVLFWLAIFNQEVEAIPYVSNLGDEWTKGGIGDIEALFPGGAHTGSDTANFTTGAGNFSLNTITLEFENDYSYPAGVAAPQWVNIQLFQKVGNANIFLGSFGNPAVDSVPTQWPQSPNSRAYTVFIDFSPLMQINLNPFSQYSIVVSMPSNSPVDAALMFATSSAYTSPAGWTMRPTTSGAGSGEYLVMAVDATPIPDQSSTAVLLISGLTGLAGCRFLLNLRNVVPQRF
jgi:hypothetical protein